MVTYSWRFVKRFIVLLPGIVIAYFSVRNILPYFDKRLPLGVAIFVTYVLGAYILIPGLIRIIRIIRPANHLPVYCVTPDGFASDPLNIGIIATHARLTKVMESAGWYLADPHTLKNTGHQVLATLLSWSYPTSPVSNLYLFGRRQDIAFEIPIGNGSSRHHVRFWATTYQDTKHLTVKSIHWHNRRAHVRGDKLLWVGAASLDIGIAPIRHNLQLTHMIDPDTNQERELIVSQLGEARLIAHTDTVILGSPYQLVNRAIRGYLKTDGRMKVITLKSK